MNNRLSYASSPESDGEMRPNSMYEDDDDDEPSPIPKRKMIRSSSDPSINTQENIPGIPPYPAPPNYHRDRQVSNRLVGHSHMHDRLTTLYLLLFKRVRLHKHI